MLFDVSESGCAVQSSALCDGITSLHSGSVDCVAAHLSISMTEHHHHRQSSAIRPHHRVWRRRQDNVRSVGLDLHQVSSAVAELHRSAR